MEPGTRVTMLQDKRAHYGTVVDEHLNDAPEETVYVIWDRFPNRFMAYSCGEVREVRPGEEERHPETK